MTSSHSWPVVLTALVHGEDLAAEATAWVMDEIMSGQATSAQVAGLAVALRAKGETVAEVEGLVQTMYEHATPVSVIGPSLDIVGTGGDRAQTVNISTMAAVVAAGAGARVVKHGNRAASSRCGSADLLEELGVRLDLAPDAVAKVADNAGITFCFAPLFHPALRHTATARKELGIATIFNFLGPLANPARPTAQAVGVADQRMAAIMAGVLARRGTSALVFRGDDGLDELTTSTTSHVWVVRDGAVAAEVLDPVDVGIARSGEDALRGGDPAANAVVARATLAGQRGPVRDAVLLNAAAGLAAYEPSGDPLLQRLAAGLERAEASIDSGSAAAVLERWVSASNGG